MAGPATARCLIAVTPDGERTMSTFLGASINGIAVDRRYQRFTTLSNVDLYTAGYRFTGSLATQSEDAFAVKLVEPSSLTAK